MPHRLQQWPPAMGPEAAHPLGSTRQRWADSGPGSSIWFRPSDATEVQALQPILKVPPQLHRPPAVIPHKLPHLGHGDSQRETAEMSRGSSKAGLLLPAVRGASYVGSCWKGKGNGGEGVRKRVCFMVDL